MNNQELLQSLADKLLPLFDNMPPVKVFVVPHPHFIEGNALAFWYQNAIYVRPDYVQKVDFDGMVNTLKHELIHAWIDWKGLYTDDNDGHNKAFIRKAVQLGLNIDSTINLYLKAKKVHDQLIEEERLFERAVQHYIKGIRAGYKIEFGSFNNLTFSQRLARLEMRAAFAEAKMRL